jgi:hypothetical protein
MGTRVEALSKGGIDEVVEHFAEGARMLAAAGFDSIELHFGHHYLLSSFMSPKWNQRRDEYGGSVENRARLPRQVLRAVRDAVGERVAVTAKMNMVDGVAGGLEIEESLRFAKLYESEGVLDALELTGGGSRANQMFMFRGDAPRKEMAAILPPLQRLGFKLFGRAIFKEYPFEEATSSDGAVPARPSRCRSSCSAASTPSTRSAVRWPRASSSSRWAGRSCASPTSSSACARAPRRAAAASTATSAWSASSRAPAACSTTPRR